MAVERRSVVVGVFSDREAAERAIAELHRLGFHDDQVGFAMRGEHGVVAKEPDEDEKAAEVAARGMIAGAGLGVIAAAAALLLPGVGPVLAGGILATIIGGAAAGAAAGGLIGTLAGLGIPKEEAEFYETEFNTGRILVMVRADGRGLEAFEAMRRAGGYNMANRRAA